MTNKACRNTRREIDEAELHQALSESAATHIQLCSSCRDFRKERTRLRDLVGSLDPVSAPADFDFRLRARLAARTEPSHRRFFAGFGFRVPATIAAAVLVMFVGSIVWLNHKTETQRPPVANSQQSDNSSASNATASSSNNRDTVTPTSNVEINKPAGTGLVAVTGRKPGGAASSKTRGRSYDFSEKAAQSIRGSDDAGTVSLAAPLKPIVVSMEDDRGATRTISLPPVSFGSQRLVDNRIPISANNRVW